MAPGAAGPCRKTVGENKSESTHDPPARYRGRCDQRASQDARGAEGIVADAMWVGLRITDDDVVHEVDVDHLGGFTELPGLCEATDYGNWTTAGLTRRA